ncbi:MAG: ADP-ribosylglycohydrolase [Leptolyngbya sp. SIO4C1]|nr:ADP-ribosylglycohydrolase [Leptolyngbya sp. SIO4C1]
MLGAIIGDAIGSAYESERLKTKDFELITPESIWTDDTVLTLATADCLLYGGGYAEAYKRWSRWYPGVKGSYGMSFQEWAKAKVSRPYYSCSNISAIRVIPVAYAFDTLKDVLEEAKCSAEVTHNHPEGIKGAQATAAAVFLARTGASKEAISEFVSNIFGYDLKTPFADLQPVYRYSELIQDTVPAAITAFLGSTDFEDAIRNAVSLGGDADTLTAITGAIAEAYYKDISQILKDWSWDLLDESQQDLINEFKTEFAV